jgi:BlaI family penicillinase repressor
MADPIAISDAEWLVMNVIWREQPVDAQLVVEELAESNNWSAATIKTMLHRLVKKQALKFEQDGKRYLYRARVRQAECVKQASRSFLERVFGGSAGPALLHFVQTAQLTEEEIAELRRLLDHKEGKS